MIEKCKEFEKIIAEKSLTKGLFIYFNLKENKCSGTYRF